MGGVMDIVGQTERKKKGKVWKLVHNESVTK